MEDENEAEDSFDDDGKRNEYFNRCKLICCNYCYFNKEMDR